MSDTDDLEAFVQAIEAKIRLELRARCEAYKPDFEAPEVYAVLTGLLARQANWHHRRSLGMDTQRLCFFEL